LKQAYGLNDEQSSGVLQKTYEKFYNIGTEFCAASQRMDYYNMLRKSNLDALSVVDITLEGALRCGFNILLDTHLEVVSVFFIEYGYRLVLINDVLSFVNALQRALGEVDTEDGSTLVFDGCVAVIRKDSTGNRWIVLSDPESLSGSPFDQLDVMYRVVLSERQFNLIVKNFHTRIKTLNTEVQNISSAYNVILRELVAQTRASLRSVCEGCVKSGPGHVYICGDNDTLTIKTALHSHLKTKKILNNNIALDECIENIPQVFATVARRMREEILREERVLRSYGGRGLPLHVKNFDAALGIEHYKGKFGFDVVVDS
jgi:hypothetical protein